MKLPLLYSFRRCPYAIRARMALRAAYVAVELREVLLAKKPPQLIELSPKATVPVLQLPDGTVIDESLDIIDWALSQRDPENWLGSACGKQTKHLISINDGEFKHWLDRYKYADRYDEGDQLYFRQKALFFLDMLEDLLKNHPFLSGDQASVSDVAIFPFIRQFAAVDRSWFEASPYVNLRRWLQFWLDHVFFADIMVKHKAWQAGAEPITLFGES